MFILTKVVQPHEQFSIPFDLTDELELGETISNKTVTSKNEKTGTDTTATLIGTVSHTSSKVTVELTVPSNSNGEIHVVQAAIVTNQRPLIEREARIIIRED